MSDDRIPLGIVADRLEELGHPAQAGAVRALEFLLSLEHSTSLDDVLLFALLRLRDAGEPAMRDDLYARMERLADRRDAAAESRAGILGTTSDRRATLTIGGMKLR